MAEANHQTGREHEVEFSLLLTLHPWKNIKPGDESRFRLCAGESGSVKTSGRYNLRLAGC